MSNEPGYASRRNGSCLSTENDCGVTISPFHACCPGNTFCPGPQYNVMCCPSNATCSGIIGRNCADADDILYTSDSKDITNGGFCCAKGKYAYKTEDDSVGCADALSDLQTGMAQLPVISSPTPTPTSTLVPTSRATAGETSTVSTRVDPNTHRPSSSHTGAIAGGIVGGVAGLALLAGALWFIVRRRGKQQEVITPRHTTLNIEKPSEADSEPSELYPSSVPLELAINEGQGVSELPGEHTS